jgi:autotransporter-associated beta strand protein
LAFDAAGNLYVANVGDNSILKVTPGGAVSTFVSSGLNFPFALAFDAAGNLYVSNMPENNISINTISEVIPDAPLIVTPADWTSAGLTLTLGNDGNLHVYTTGTTTDAVPPYPRASVTNIEITAPSDTTANLSIDSTAGDPIPAGGLNYSGAGGLIISGSGIVDLSGTNTYTGGTTVSAGTLLINASSALPDGTSLTVGAGGNFVFDPSATGVSSVTCTTTAEPVTANVVSSSPVLPAPKAADIVNHSTLGRNSTSPIMPPLASQLPQPVPAVVLDTPTKRIASDLAWLAQAANSSDNSDQQRKKDVAILASEAVFAEYGR